MSSSEYDDAYDAFKAAVISGDLDTAKKLATPELVLKGDTIGAGPIHWASQKGYLHMVKWLHEAQGVPLDMKAYNGCQAMHFAGCGGKTDVVEWLHENGIAYDVEDKYGNKPFK